MLMALGLVLFLAATEPARRLLNQLAGLGPRPQPAAPAQQRRAREGGAAAEQDQQPGAAAAAPQAVPAPEGLAPEPAAEAPQAQQGPPPQLGGVLAEVRALVVGFFSSLVPGERGRFPMPARSALLHLLP